jgi:hypothetical protein
MVVYIYYISADGNSFRSQLGSSCQGNWYGTEKAGGKARPSHAKSHLLGHSQLQPARRAAMLDQTSTAFGLMGFKYLSEEINSSRIFNIRDKNIVD